MGFLMALVAVAAAAIQTGKDPLLVRLEGKWRGSGTVLSQPAQISMEWAPQLDGQFIRLTFHNTMGVAPKTRVFEGHAYYRVIGDGRYRGMWFDNSGMFRPIEARRERDSLVSSWGTPDTEQGETTYRLLPDDQMEVIDRVKGKDGTWREFGTTKFTKAR